MGRSTNPVLVQSHHTIKLTVETLSNELATSGYIRSPVAEPLRLTKLWMLNTSLLLVVAVRVQTVVVAVEPVDTGQEQDFL
tara:strand:- start:515 stop:757 length:243 start_codon:yes stop_codon:yes gene_type:complete